MFVRKSIENAQHGAYFTLTCVLVISFLYETKSMSLDRSSITYNDIQQSDKVQQQQQQEQQQLQLQLQYIDINNDNNNHNNDNHNKYSTLNRKNILMNDHHFSSNKNDENAENDNDEEDKTISNNLLSYTKHSNADNNRENDMLMIESQNAPLFINMLQLPGHLKKTLINQIDNADIVSQGISNSPNDKNQSLRDVIVSNITNELNYGMKDENQYFQDHQQNNENEENHQSEELSLRDSLESIHTEASTFEMGQEEKAADLYSDNNEESVESQMPIEKCQEEKAADLYSDNNEESVESQMPIEKFQEDSFNVLKNQLQENSAQLFDMNKDGISKEEDDISTEEEMPEECGDEYYMNSNQDTSEHSSEFVTHSKEITKPFEMESDDLEKVEMAYDLKENINNMAEVEKDDEISSSSSISNISEMEPFATSHSFIETPELASIELIEDVTNVTNISNEQININDNVNNMESTSEIQLMEKENDMIYNATLSSVGEIPEQIIHEYPEAINHEISTIKSVNSNENDNLNKIYSNSSQLQQQESLTDDMNIKKPEPIISVFNSKIRRYDGAQVWRIVVQNEKDRKLADELHIKFGGQLWKEVKQEVDYLLKPQVLLEAEQYVRVANLSRIVLIDNLQKVIEVENPPVEQITQLQNRKGHRLTWQAYHRLEDIHGFFDYLAKTYPDICSTEIIGYSIQKRPLKILKISNGEANNTGIWIDGGIHAREWISPAAVTYVANHLVEGWDDLPSYMRNINWYIHAVVNPDGYEYTHTTDRLWRKNMRSNGRLCPGVDLNRNFGYMWGGRGTSANPCSQIYRGTKAFSEPEAFYISKFISGFPKGTFKAFLTFHSYGQYILYPWGYDYLETNDTMDLDLLARQAGTSIAKSTGVKYTIGASANTLYAAAGGSDDWAKGIAEIKYTYTIEMGDTGRYGFVLPASEIECNAKNAYTVVETISRGIKMGKNGRKRKMKVLFK